jgi:uncharacterized protein YjbI with pentapeptide repeats
MIMRTGGKPPTIEYQSEAKEIRPRCQYSDKWDSSKCTNPLAPGNSNNLCIFHDREYVNKKEKEVAVEFKLLVHNANNNESHDSLFCRGFYIPEINFERFEFNREIDFRGAHFKKVNFRKSIFNNKVDFDSATFSEEAEFTDATFSEEAVFKSVSFVKDVDFRGANFEEADFHLVHASCKAAFDSATFSEKADFTTATFLESANFHFTKFERGAVFTYSRFLKEAKFIEAKFIKSSNSLTLIYFYEKSGNEATFDFTTFSEYVDFGNARFPEKTQFRYSVFKGDTDFSDATFGIFEKKTDLNSEADFTASTFLQLADFSGAKFIKAYFISTSFGEKTDFIKTEFKEAYFTQAYFSGQATFYDTTLGDKPDFSDVLFENAQKVLFSVKQLHATSFINTNVTSVRFIKNLRLEPEEWDTENNKEKVPSDLEALKAVYRNIRENYENSFRFIDAQIYHKKELDLKRKYREVLCEDGSSTIVKPNCWFRRNLSLTGLYYFISRYGYNYNRAIIIAAIVLAIPIIYSTVQQSFSPEGINATKSVESATNSAKDVLHIERSKDLIGSLIGIAAIPILGGIILAALKRTFDIRRKS